MKIIQILFTAIICLFAVFTANAAEKEPSSAQTQGLEVKQAIEKPRLLPGKLLFYADAYEGYDNNVNLDSQRKEDAYTEIDIQMGYKYPFNSVFGATLNYYLNSLNYYDVTDATYYDNNLALDLDTNLFDKKAKLTWENAAGYIYYPHESTSTFFSYDSQLGLKHSLTKTFSHKLSYDFIFREYPDRKAGDGRGAARETNRKDIRNSIAYELSGLLVRDIFVRFNNQYYVNDSNDQYMDYYDYWSYRATLTAMMPLLTKRLYGLVTLGYQRRDYGSRQLVDDASKTERDNTYEGGSSLIFDITKKFSMSLNYLYRQNESNEPSEKYSGSMISAGLHYAF